jgi:hypothetical protein
MLQGRGGLIARVPPPTGLPKAWPDWVKSPLLQVVSLASARQACRQGLGRQGSGARPRAPRSRACPVERGAPFGWGSHRSRASQTPAALHPQVNTITRSPQPGKICFHARARRRSRAARAVARLHAFLQCWVSRNFWPQPFHQTPTMSVEVLRFIALGCRVHSEKHGLIVWQSDSTETAHYALVCHGLHP